MAYRYCQRCGNANQSGSRFCEACGANLDEQAAWQSRQSGAAHYPGPQPTPSYVQKKSGGAAKIIIPIIIVLLLAGGGVFAYFNFFAKTEVDLVGGFDDKVLNTTGKSGEIRIIDLDMNKIRELQHYNDADPKVQKFLESVDYEYDREGEDDLANGDKVVITATFSEKKAEECGVRVVNAKNGMVDTTVKIVGRDEKKDDVQQSDNSDNYYDDGYYSNSSDTGDQNSGRDYSMDRDDTYYDVSETELEYNDVKDWDKEEIQNWINYIFAKNGYEFHESGKVKDQFESMEWYNNISGKSRSNEVVEKRLVGIEKENYKVLVKARKNKN